MLSKPPSTHPTIPATRRGLSLTLLTSTRNPSQLVRGMYLSPDLVPHAMLSGETAETIGTEELGIPTVDPSYFWTEARWKEHCRGLGLPEELDTFSDNDTAVDVESIPEAEKVDLLDLLPKGTVGAVALDIRGCIAVVTSTGGRTNKLVGRIGDTPLMGSGFWAEEWVRQRSLFGKTWDLLKGKRSVQGIGISGTGDGDVCDASHCWKQITDRLRLRDFSISSDRTPLRQSHIACSSWENL